MSADLNWAFRPRCDATPAWTALTQQFENSGRALHLRTAFAQDPSRVEHFSQRAPHLFADLSKNLIDAPTEALLLDLARQCGVETLRDAMFAGQAINTTEQRAVMHWLLRCPQAALGHDLVPNQPPALLDTAQAAIKTGVNQGLATQLEHVHHTLDAMLAYAMRVRANRAITDVVTIGIGGSDLGPQMAVRALDAYIDNGQRFHFVSNVDPHELARTLRPLQAASTLFLVASKTFTTAETMANAEAARDWFLSNGGTDINQHFAALTTNISAARDFGITACFGFWDWVGGRYSLWSAIGLPIAIAVGPVHFKAMLAGAHEMDTHFQNAPLARNLPVRLALIDVWYRNFHHFTSRSIAPYHSLLSRLPAYLQQLEMESNGKRVDVQGRALPYATAPVLWGEPGTNGQHANFQMLHQGTDVVPVEIVLAAQPNQNMLEQLSNSEHQHIQLCANALAQAQALMLGKADEGGHKHFPGNRPSTVLLLDALSPASLGALIALQEHRVFVSGAIWGINSFDQWGVELGKVLAQNLGARLQAPAGPVDVAGLDGSTAALLARLRTTLAAPDASSPGHSSQTIV